MRVTLSMLTAQVIQNLGRNLERFARIEEQLSSARRINRASDDPIGTVRVLEFRHQQHAIAQYQKDIQHGQAWLAGTDTALGTVNNQLIEALDLVVNLSNDTIGDDQRDSLAARVDAIIDQVLEAANSKVGDRYIFSGTVTDRQAIIASGTGVVYNGNLESIRTKIGSESYIDLNTLGLDTFTRAFTTLGHDADLNVAVTGGTRVIDLNGGAGIAQAPGVFEIVDRNGTAVVTVDVSAAATVNDVLTTINNALLAAGVTNVQATISPSGDGIRLEATPDGIVTADTLLENLNSGTGVDQSPGTFTMRKTDGSAEVTIDLTGAVTVQDVIDRFNSTMGAAGYGTVFMSLRLDGLGLQITDFLATPNGFEIVETTASDTTAADLGLAGILGTFLQGAALNPEPDYEVRDVGTGFTTASDLGLVGRFHRVQDGADINPVLTTSSAVVDLNFGQGLELGRLRIASGDRTVTVDLSTAATVGDILSRLNGSGLPIEARINENQTGIEILSTADDRSLIVTSDSLRTAEDLEVVGSPDLFGNLYLLRDALEQNNGELVRYTNESVQGALDQILFERSRTGTRQIRLEATDFRLLEQALNVTRLRSEYEDADILKVSSELSKQEAVYQAALAAAARMIQPSLVQFLR